MSAISEIVIRVDHGRVLELNFNRPPVNALSPEMVRVIRENIASAYRENWGALVLSGRPGMFSAGLDVVELLTLDEDAMREFWKDFFGLLRDLAKSSIPVAAAVTGHSPAGGAVLALFCDYRVAAEGDFKIGLNEVQVGLPLPEVIYLALVHAIGARAAEKIAVPGQLVSPQQALELGLVDELHPADRVTGEAIAWCEKLLALPPLAMHTTRQRARADISHVFDGMDSEAHELMNRFWFGEETQEIMKSLVERLASKPDSSSTD